MDYLDDYDRAYSRWEAALQSDIFEEAFHALEEAVDCLETGRLTLERSLSCFEIGARLAERCDRMLSEAELRVSRLDEVLSRVGWVEGANGDQTDDFDE